MRLLLALVMFLAGAVPALAQHGEVRRYFDAWLGACRTDGYCSATAYVNPNPGDGTVADYIFRIGRHAEEIYWELSFTTVKTMGDKTAPFDVFVGDDNIRNFWGSDQIAPFGALNDFFFLGQGAQQLMDWLPPADELSVTFTDVDALQHEASFSLEGLNAALIWIDEQQRRLGSERVAEAAPIGLPPAGQPAVASVTIDGIPADLVAQDSARPDACDGFEINDDPAYVHDLGDGQTLFLLPCTRGAYNHFYSVYIGHTTWYDLQLFATLNGDAGWQAEEGIWFDSYDPATRILSSYNRGNSMGACGRMGRWVWAGSSFFMIDYRASGDCSGSNQPGQFPLVYENTELPPDLRP